MGHTEKRLILNMDKVDLAIKVDIDSYLGAKKGVPKLLDLFKEQGIHATFFASVGPDMSGRAIFRAYDPRFIKRMLKLGAGKTYGKSTLLYGTLIRAPVIGREAKGELRRIMEEGHEVGLHAYNHIAWHSNMKSWPKEKIKKHLSSAISLFEEVYGHKPRAFASPGWQYNRFLVELEDSIAFDYCSDTRGTSCFYPDFSGKKCGPLQVPTTLPTFDELLMLGYEEEGAIGKMIGLLSSRGYNIMNIHPEFEGSSRFDLFCRFLDKLKKTRKVKFFTLGDIAMKEKDSGCSGIVWGRVKGRYGTLGCQVA